jgi:hypothetical protein
MTGLLTRRILEVQAGIVVMLVGGIPAGAAVTDSFQLVGNMVEARDGAQATLLTDGTVLLTGGNHYVGNDGGPVASAELFDPKTNQFSAVGPMHLSRDDSHRAVRLPDGRVLVAYGAGGNDPAMAEIFDPVSRVFTAAGSLRHRGGPTATLLPDGRVLMAGGWNPDEHGPTASAEMYDPATGTSQGTGDMTSGRYRHAAVALPDGRVALVGGYGAGNQALGSVEIYDPKVGTFTGQGSLVRARADVAASLLADGRIMVVAGIYTDASGQQAGARDNVEIYDPATGQSTIASTLPDAPWFPAVAPTIDGRFLVAGGGALGSGGGLSPLATAELVDPQAGTTSLAPPLMMGRVGAAAVKLPDGRILIAGGWGGPDGSSLNTAEVYVSAAMGKTPP